MTPLFQVPVNTLTEVWGAVNRFLAAGIGKFAAVMIGIMLFFWAVEWLIGLLVERAAERRDIEGGLFTILRGFRVPAGRAERIAARARREPSLRRAIELHKRFEEVEAGEGISVNTT